LVVYQYAETGDPLQVAVKSEVGDPLVVYQKTDVGDPLHVIVKTEVDDNPPVVFIQVPEPGPDPEPDPEGIDPPPPLPVIPTPVPTPEAPTTDPSDPSKPIEKSAVGDPLVVFIYSKTGEPLYYVMPTTPDDDKSTPSVIPPAPPAPNPDPQDPVPDEDNPGVPEKPSINIPGPTPDPAPKAPSEVAHETTAITNGRLAGLAFTGARGTWLADHSYESANIVLSKDLREDDWRRVEAPFAGIDGAWLRVENDHSHIEMDSVNVIAGYAVKTRREGNDGKPDSSFLWGGFIDIGQGNYDTYDEFSHVADGAIPDIHGDGTLRSYGLGLMARKEWANGLRLEGSLRAGKLENEFTAVNYLGADNVPMSYETDTPYFGAHVGIARTFKLANPSNEIDLRLRYYWDRQGGETVVLPSGEMVEFGGDDSRRLRFGARYTHEDDHLRRWYIGAAVEHEFAGNVHGRTGNFNLPLYDNLYDLHSESLEGTTGIAELGVDIRPFKDRNFSLATGIQGYFGKYRGVSAGIRFEWEF
jgi:outer membrane autotransporter protein